MLVSIELALYPRTYFVYLSLPQEIERAFGEAEREMARTRSACVCRWT